jgi:adenosylmethionine-8-amino-7-oxononanoate aminotransferase
MTKENAHEAAHALDTVYQVHSSTKRWKVITKKKGKKIYPHKGNSSIEAFAGAMAWRITNKKKLKKISKGAYNYINKVIRKAKKTKPIKTETSESDD